MNKYFVIFLVLIAWTAMMGQIADEVATEETAAPKDDADFYAADQSVFVMPTAYTMPRGEHALTSFELILVQYSYSASDRLHISAGSIFPVTSDALRSFSLGFKYRYFTKKPFDAAAWTSYTPDADLMTIGSVLSLGQNNRSVHLAAAGYLDFKEEIQRVIFALGGITPLTSRTMLMGEVIAYPETEYVWETDEDVVDHYGLGAIVGLRFKGSKISWDLGGMRLLSEDMGEVIAIPFIKATFLF